MWDPFSSILIHCEQSINLLIPNNNFFATNTSAYSILFPLERYFGFKTPDIFASYVNFGLKLNCQSGRTSEYFNLEKIKARSFGIEKKWCRTILGRLAIEKRVRFFHGNQGSVIWIKLKTKLIRRLLYGSIKNYHRAENRSSGLILRLVFCHLPINSPDSQDTSN